MTDTAILSCPFCASADVTVDEIDSDRWAVCCTDCGCIGPSVTDDGSAALGEKVIALWNTRP